MYEAVLIVCWHSESMTDLDIGGQLFVLSRVFTRNKPQVSGVKHACLHADGHIKCPQHTLTTWVSIKSALMNLTAMI